MTTIHYEWAEPEPEIVAQRLFHVADELEDLIEPMTIAGELTRQDIQENFDTQTDPSGAPWEPHAASYEPYALAHGSGAILNLTGALKGAATSPSAYIPTNSGLFLSTAGFPEYWAWNNFGAERSTKAAKEDSTANKAFRRQHRLPFGALHGENRLPERPFIGLSAEAREKIDAAFALWFDGVIALGTSSRGTPFAQHAKRGAGGRFVPR